jgi:hypothetical protein
VDTVCVVQGLSRPLLSYSIIKELGLLHPKFPHHLTSQEKADKKAPSSGVVQMLAVEERPLKTEPKRVQFGSPQGRTDAKMSCMIDVKRVMTEISKKARWTEPTCISESDMSVKEGEEPAPERSTRPLQGREARSMHGHPDPRRSSKTHFSGRLHRAEEQDVKTTFAAGCTCSPTAEMGPRRK